MYAHSRSAPILSILTPCCKNALQCANKQHRHSHTYTHTQTNTTHFTLKLTPHSHTSDDCKLLPLVHVTPTLPKGWTRVWGRSRPTCTCLSSKNTEIQPDTYQVKTPKSNRVVSSPSLWLHATLLSIQELDLFLVTRPLSCLSLFQNLNPSENEKSVNVTQGSTEVPNCSGASITSYITLFSILKLKLFLVTLPLSLPSSQRFEIHYKMSKVKLHTQVTQGCTEMPKCIHCPAGRCDAIECQKISESFWLHVYILFSASVQLQILFS